MITNFLIDSRYGGPQMINDHLKSILKIKQKTIYFDLKNNEFNFSNFKKISKILFLIDVILNFCKLYLKKKRFEKSKVFFVYSILNIVPIIFGIVLKKNIIWYILEKPNKIFYLTFKILTLSKKIKIICISKSLSKFLRIKKYYTYFPSIDGKFWNNKKKFKKKKNYKYNLICVGNLNKIKNHLNFIYCLENMNIDYTLNIIGKKLNTQKNYFNQLKNLIKEINKKNIKIKIYQNKKKKFIKKLLLKSDLYILPSISEGLSISLVEAMSVKLICLINKPSNHSKLIINNFNGFEFELNEKSLSKTFKIIDSLNENKKNRIRSNARETVKRLILRNKLFEKNFKNIFF